MILRRTGRSSGVATRAAASLPAAIAVVFVLSWSSQVRAEEPAPTNLDVMTRLGDQIAEDIIAKIQPDVRGVRLEIVPGASTEEYVLLEDIFTRHLEAKGIDTVSRSSAAADSLYALDYKIPVFRLSYPKVYRSYLIGGKKVRREANLKVTARLTSYTGDVVWIGESSAHYSDQFPHSDITRIQEGSYEFVQPEMPGSGWGKVVEPVLVTGIIVGMVYLFFSNQSDS